MKRAQEICRGGERVKCSTLEVISCVFRRALTISSSIIKRKCKTEFSTKFRTMGVKADVCSVRCTFQSISTFFHLVFCT